MVHDSENIEKSFLQSAEWEAFERRLGRKTHRIDGKLVVRHDLPLGVNYLYAPRPSFRDEDECGKFLAVAAGIAKKEKSVFLKIEPLSTFHIPHYYTSHNLQPRETLILDLSKTEDALLAEMHPKTRYNIRLAVKHGVKVEKKSGNDSIKAFFSLLGETAQREGFHAHDERHYRTLFEICTDVFWNELYFAEYKGKILAAAMVNFYRESGTATYLHGASSREYKEVMAPHLLHWEIMREAKSRGFSAYDFWGIDEKRWPGVTRFKLGFGGKTVQYPEAGDTIFRPMWYQVYQVARKIF
mgnify:CR=1 FL=1